MGCRGLALAAAMPFWVCWLRVVISTTLLFFFFFFFFFFFLVLLRHDAFLRFTYKLPDCTAVPLMGRPDGLTQQLTILLLGLIKRAL